MIKQLVIWNIYKYSHFSIVPKDYIQAIMDQELSMLNNNDVSEKQTQQDMKSPENIEKHKRDQWANKLDFLAR